MKILVTGINGQLGHDVMNELLKRGHIALGVDVQEMDITEKTTVFATIGREHPDAVIHCAAWTAVDMAEDDDKAALVHHVNADGTRNIAEACKAVDAKMIYISTDYVFDGKGTEPWKPDCKDYKP